MIMVLDSEECKRISKRSKNKVVTTLYCHHTQTHKRAGHTIHHAMYNTQYHSYLPMYLGPTTDRRRLHSEDDERRRRNTQRNGPSIITAPKIRKEARSMTNSIAIIPPTTSSWSAGQLAMVAPASAKTLPKNSQSIPFLRRPQHLTSQYAGDVGFDPLNFATSPEQLVQYREAEVKHARLAMLAAAGWPLSEKFDAPLAELVDEDFGLNLKSALLADGSDRVPSLLNGGMDGISPWWWGFCLGLTAAIDLAGLRNARYSDVAESGSPEYLPGDYGFDPLNLYPADKEGRARMQLAEIKHGRLAMIAVTGFAAQEFVSKVGVVDETPLFFQPFHF